MVASSALVVGFDGQFNLRGHREWLVQCWWRDIHSQIADNLDAYTPLSLEISSLHDNSSSVPSSSSDLVNIIPR